MKVARVTLIAARRKHQPQALSDSPTTPKSHYLDKHIKPCFQVTKTLTFKTRLSAKPFL